MALTAHALYRLSQGPMSYQHAKSETAIAERDAKDQAESTTRDLSTSINSALREQSRLNERSMDAAREIAAESNLYLYQVKGEMQALSGQMSSVDASIQGLAAQLNVGLSNIEGAIERAMDVLRTGFNGMSGEISRSIENAADKQIEAQRFDSCRTYRALKTKVRHDFAKRLVAIAREHDQLSGPLHAIKLELERLRDAAIEEEVAAELFVQNEHIVHLNAERHVKRRNIQEQINNLLTRAGELRPQAGASVSGLFGRDKQRARISDAQAELTKIGEDMLALRKQLAVIPILKPFETLKSFSDRGYEAAYTRGRDKIRREFESTVVGIEILNNEPAAFDAVMPEVDFVTCRMIEDAISELTEGGAPARHPTLGDVPSAAEVMEMLIELRPLESELARLSQVRPELLQGEVPKLRQSILLIAGTDAKNFIGHALMDDEQIDESAARLDEYFDQTVQFLADKDAVSVKDIQRSVKMGHARSLKILAQLEAAGLVAPAGEEGLYKVLSI